MKKIVMSFHPAIKRFSRPVFEMWEFAVASFWFIVLVSLAGGGEIKSCGECENCLMTNAGFPAPCLATRGVWVRIARFVFIVIVLAAIALYGIIKLIEAYK
jgi:hypothetical protein